MWLGLVLIRFTKGYFNNCSVWSNRSVICHKDPNTLFFLICLFRCVFFISWNVNSSGWFAVNVLVPVQLRLCRVRWPSWCRRCRVRPERQRAVWGEGHRGAHQGAAAGRGLHRGPQWVSSPPFALIMMIWSERDKSWGWFLVADVCLLIFWFGPEGASQSWGVMAERHNLWPLNSRLKHLASLEMELNPKVLQLKIILVSDYSDD